MALVSISEASRLTNKSRTTVHRYISKGKLSIPMEGERHAFTLTPSSLSVIEIDIPISDRDTEH